MPKPALYFLSTPSLVGPCLPSLLAVLSQVNWLLQNTRHTLIQSVLPCAALTFPPRAVGEEGLAGGGREQRCLQDQILPLWETFDSNVSQHGLRRWNYTQVR